MKQKLLLTLALLLPLIVGGVKAQQTLPYEYGFENNDLSADGWVLQGATYEETNIDDRARQNGSYGFMFRWNEENAYLLSPVFTGVDKGFSLSFWYRECISDYGDEEFQVGYTTDETVTDASQFTYGDVVTASLDWQEYSNTFPAGTKRIAIKYIYGDHYYLFLDDFTFTVGNLFRPTGLTASNVTYNSVELSWTENGDATAWEICLNNDEENVISANANHFMLTDLALETIYTAKVRAVAGDEHSLWSSAVSFTTLAQFEPPADLVVSDVFSQSATVSWTAGTAATSTELQYAEGFLDWYKYDNDDALGDFDAQGSAFSYGVMFPAGSYAGSVLTKVSVYDFDATTTSVTIYSGGDKAPGDVIATLPLMLTGADKFVEVDCGNLAIDNTKNLWVIVNNEHGAIAATDTDELNDPNGRWIYLDGRWNDLASYDVSGVFKVRAEIGEDLSNLTWTTVADAASPTELTSLNPETNYVVRVKSIYGEEGESKWVQTGFTTPEYNFIATDVYVDVINRTASIIWNGESDSYKVRYRNVTSDGEWQEVTTDETSVELKGLEMGTEYEFTIIGIKDNVENAGTPIATFTTADYFMVPADLAVSDVTASTATISWTGQADSYNLRYRKTSFWEDFESSTSDALPSGWTTIDADGDGYAWYTFNVFDSGNNQDDQGNPYVFDTQCATSASYFDVALTPDNWLITPQVSLNGTLSLWLRAQETGWPDEHFAIYVSTTGNEIADFTTVLVPESVTTGVLVEYTADLSVFAGQMGYIAIRHFNCTDMYRLNVDNFAITDPSVSEEWVEVGTATAPYTLEGLEPLTHYEVQVQAVYGDNESQWAPVGFTTLDGVEVMFAKEGYATYYNGQNDVVLPEGMKALVVTGNSDHLDYAAIAGQGAETSVVPAATAVLLQVEEMSEPRTFLISLAEPTADAISEENYLYGSDTEVETTGGEKYYKMTYSNSDDNFGWYWGAANGAAFTSPAHKAWLALPASSAPFFGLPGFGDTTGIIGVGNAQPAPENGAWFTLQGMKLGKKPTQHGIYIYNGKKVRL